MRKNTVTKRINNLPLKTKILAITLIGVCTMAIVSFLAVQILSGSYNELLYDTLSNSITYSSSGIEEYMEEMEDLTSMFLSDEKVQTNLTEVKTSSEEGYTSLMAVANLRNYIAEYYQNFSDGILKYISLYMPGTVVYTNVIAADRTPGNVQEEIIAQANLQDGGLCWVTDYIEDYGLFLARNIRKIEGLTLDNLGTILLNVDMDALIAANARLDGQYGESAYVILNGSQILYHTDNLTFENAVQVQKASVNNYSVLELNGKSYFAAHGGISRYGWDYYCLISYNGIARQLARVKWVSFVIVILDLLVVICLSVRLVGRLMVHVSRLIHKMRQFAADNTKVPQVDYDYSDRGDELGLLNRQFDEMSETIIRLIQENYVNEILKKEAQLKALENQINPHFLYNTLDSIKWRAKAIGEKNISSMVEALALLLRTSLGNRQEASFTLARELQVVSSYITIQKLRYEDRLNFENRIDPRYGDTLIPKLVVQPLVENAIYYGLETNVEACYIIVTAMVMDGILRIYVKNTGSEFEDDLIRKLETGEIRPHGHGVGLINIDRRIKMQYGKDFGLILYNEEDYAVAELSVPAAREEVAQC